MLCVVQLKSLMQIQFQMLDMIKPARSDCVTLGDLKRCRMTHVFFDTFFNLEKYLDHEQRDPFASHRDEYVSQAIKIFDLKKSIKILFEF